MRNLDTTKKKKEKPMGLVRDGIEVTIFGDERLMKIRQFPNLHKNKYNSQTD
jgi:hypothetical protein